MAGIKAVVFSRVWLRKRISKRKFGKSVLEVLFLDRGWVCGMAQLQILDGPTQFLSSMDFFGWITVATPVGIGGKPVRLSHCACTELSA